MKIFKNNLYILLTAFLGMAFFTTCQNDFDDGKKNNETIIHNLPKDDNGNGQDGNDVDKMAERQDDPNRRNWQKPREVIRSLGDLSDKTVADIGAGSGYFSFRLVQTANKVIAIDIDKDAVEEIDSLKAFLPDELKSKMETRLVNSDNPMLKNEEVDVVFISNTYTEIQNRLDYLKTVKEGIKPGGKIYIVDYKKKRLPPFLPAQEARLPLYQVENELETAGFQLFPSNDQMLDYQYIVIAGKMIDDK